MNQPLVWEWVSTQRFERPDGSKDALHTFRSAVPGGWMVSCSWSLGGGMGMSFLPDAEHSWNPGGEEGGGGEESGGGDAS